MNETTAELLEKTKTASRVCQRIAAGIGEADRSPVFYTVASQQVCLHRALAGCKLLLSVTHLSAAPTKKRVTVSCANDVTHQEAIWLLSPHRSRNKNHNRTECPTALIQIADTAKTYVPCRMRFDCTSPYKEAAQPDAKAPGC